MDTGLQCDETYGSGGVDATLPYNVFTIPGNGSWSIVGGRARGDWWRPDMRGQPGCDWSAEGSVGQWRPAVDMRHSSPANPTAPFNGQ